MLREYFKFAFQSLRSRKVRSWLTMLGIFIGIAAVVALISLGEGLQHAIQEEFNKIGVNRIIITAAGSIGGPMSGDTSVANIYEEDADVVGKVRGVDYAMGVIGGTLKVEFRDEIKYNSIMGIGTDSAATEYIEGIDFFEIGFGRNPKAGSKYEAVLGYKLANDRFDKPVKVGDNINIADQQFKVVGIQKLAGTGVHDTMIRIPKETIRILLDKPEEVSTIFVRTDPSMEPSVVAENIKRRLRKERNVDVGKEDFEVQTAEQAIGTFTTVFSVVQAVLVGLAAISLIVGGIGIMNTMYTAVLERTKEIGIMKAIGAKNSDILLLFLIESGVLGLMGGAIGVLIGMGISKTVEIVATQQLGTSLLKAYYPAYLIIGALAFSFIVGSAAGLLPAKQAASMKPVDSLRYE